MPRSLLARITLALVALTLTLVAVSSVAVTSLTRLGGAVATILRENYRSVIACEDMKEALERQDSAAQFASTGHDDIARPMLAAHRAGFARAFDVEAHNVTLPGEDAGVRELAALYRDYVATVDRVLARPADAARAEAYFRELLPRFTRIKDVVQRVLRMNQANMEDADRRAKAMARASVAITLGVGAIALLLAVWFAWRLPRTLVRPVRALAETVRAIGDGALEADVPDPGVRELVPLADAFRKAVAQLRAYRRSSLGELLAAKDLANATVKCQLDPVIVFGRADDILLTNAAAERVFRVEAGGADALREADVAVPDAFVALRDRVLATGEVVAPRSLAEAMLWDDRAGERYFLLRAAPLRTEDDGITGVIVVAQDVTRLHRIDALKSDMVATVSHEFKTPLTSLRMATHLLLEPASGALTDDQRQVVTMARDDTERLRALVDELLDLVRIETEAGELHRVPVDPRALLQGALDAHRAIAREKGVELAIAPGEPAGPLRADPEKLGIVLANLVSNAIRHTPANGRVVLSAERTDDAVRITVRDTGEGMSSQDLARVRDRRGAARGVAPSGGRHGLGLTIAQEIVLQHGGELRVESTVGQGTAFVMLLPVEPLRASAPPPEVRAAAPAGATA